MYAPTHGTDAWHALAKRNPSRPAPGRSRGLMQKLRQRILLTLEDRQVGGGGGLGAGAWGRALPSMGLR